RFSRDWSSDVCSSDLSYSYTFPSGGLMNTDGEYTVIVSYGNTIQETTFQFTAAAQWRTIDAIIGGESHRIEYMITGTGNSLDGRSEERRVGKEYRDQR